MRWNSKVYFMLCMAACVTSVFGANIILPSSPVGSSFYILPGVYGATGDNYFLNSTFNAPNGGGASGSAVTITGVSTFILANTGIINQSVGGGSGVGSLRAIVLAKAGATSINQGTINGISNSATENTFGMATNSVQSGLPTRSAYAYNYGTITMQGASTDGMHAAGTTAVRSYVFNYGTINVSDRVTGVSSWVEGVSASGNGAGTNETTGIINANSKAGSRGSSGMFGGFNQNGFNGTNAFAATDPQMINQGTINSSGDSHGFYYWGDFKTFERNDAVVSVTGRGHGAYFDNAGTAGAGSGFENSANGTIMTNNDNSYGIYLRFSNNIYAINYGSIQTIGNRAHGIVAYSVGAFTTNSADGNINVNGDSSAGIFYSAVALSNTNFQWNLGNIAVNGTNSFGIATPQSFFRNDGIITVRGANSFGMLAGGSYNIVPDGTIPDNTNLGGLTPLSTAQGAAQTVINYGVINAAAALTYALGAQGSNSAAVNSQDATINVSGSGVGMLARSGGIAQNFGNIIVGASSTGMSIDTGSEGFNFGIIDFTAQNGTLIGYIDNSGTLLYEAGNGNASYTIQGTLINSGVISLGGIPGNTLSITNNYFGQNGIINLNTFLQGDGSPSNMLVIDGGTATGSTAINVQNIGGLGAVTFGNGILVVNAINGGTTAPTAFSLGNGVIAGPYEYTLHRGNFNGTPSDDWYLRSLLYDPDEPSIPGFPGYVPDYRKEVSLYTAAPSMVLLYARTMISSFHERVGAEEQVRIMNPDAGPIKGLWSRVINRGGCVTNDDIFHNGPDFNYHFLALQTGFDLLHKEYGQGQREFAGIYGTMGNGDGNVQHFTGINAGSASFNAYGIGGYWTHISAHDWYIDGVLQANRYEGNNNSGRITLTTPTGTSYAASLESGYPFKVSQAFSVEPEAQVVYQTFDGTNAQDPAAIIHFDPLQSLVSRLGARFVFDALLDSAQVSHPRKISVWLTGSAFHESKGQSVTTFSSAAGPIAFSSTLAGTWVEANAGITAQVTKEFSLYGTLVKDAYTNGRGQSYSVMGGIRVNV